MGFAVPAGLSNNHFG